MAVEGPPIPEGVKERSETFEIPEHIEKEGVVPVPTQVTAKVADDGGKPLIQSQATKQVAVQLPATQSQLSDWSHGLPESSLTWFANFWLRLIKKAVHFGWRIIGRGGTG